jgi:hypothetical protein
MRPAWPQPADPAPTSAFCVIILSPFHDWTDVDAGQKHSHRAPRRAMQGHHFCFSEQEEGEPMIYEMRVYRCAPGRLPALLKRFETITIEIWKKHGIRQAGFWTTMVGESNQDLTYLLEWQSLDEREKKWHAFQTDPEWISKRNETERDGPIVASVMNQLLTPTSFSSVK